MRNVGLMSVDTTPHDWLQYFCCCKFVQVFACYMFVFSTRCNIYISRLCYDVSVRLSVHLSVTFVHCGHWSQGAMDPDIFACLDRWMSLLLTDNAPPRSSDGMMPGFLVEEGRGMEKFNCRSSDKLPVLDHFYFRFPPSWI